MALRSSLLVALFKSVPAAWIWASASVRWMTARTVAPGQCGVASGSIEGSTTPEGSGGNENDPSPDEPPDATAPPDSATGDASPGTAEPWKTACPEPQAITTAARLMAAAAASAVGRPAL